MACLGLMAAGKSSVGRILAERLGWRFVDVDDEIEARTGKTVAELAELGGEAAYRPHERAVVVETLSSAERSVLAAPGGVAVDAAARGAIRADGVRAVYLRADPDTLAERVVEDDDHDRPLVEDEPLRVLKEMFAERDSIYRSLAQHVVQVDGRTHCEVAELVLAALADEAGQPPRAIP